MHRLFALCLPLACLAGCPQTGTPSGATALISISSTRGEPPLEVVVSAAQSQSAAPITRYTWDFAGLATAEGLTATYTFTSPGRYPITLTIVDANGQQAVARLDVRVAGGPVAAQIDADRTEGPAPLVVHFDGTGSTAEDDTIYDYFWDFGDGQESRQPAPIHLYEEPGTYLVTLRAVSAGGVENTADATITVTESAAAASLQFASTQYATLPLTAAPATLSAFTAEIWFRPDDGGTVWSGLSPALGVTATPASGTLRVSGPGGPYDLAASLSADAWHHVAIAYENPDATIYLDGVLLGTAALGSDFTPAALRIGNGFRGNIAQAVFWAVARTAEEIAADAAAPPSGADADLIGSWPLDDGSGQTLRNRRTGGAAGTLGATPTADASDPAWSSDGP